MLTHHSNPPVPVPILLSVCNATQGLHTEDSTMTGTWMQLLKVQGRYMDVSVLLQNGFMPNLWITTHSFDGLVDTCIQGHFCFTNYSLLYCHVNHHCLSHNLVIITSTECHCRRTDHIPTNSSKKHVFHFSTLTHYALHSFTSLSPTCSLSRITFINQVAVCLNVTQCCSTYNAPLLHRIFDWWNKNLSSRLGFSGGTTIRTKVTASFRLPN